MQLKPIDVSTRNMIFFSAGKSISLLGSSIYTFAMGLYVLKVSGSALSFAANLVLGLLPVVFVNPFAGVLADRVNRKLVAVSADTCCGIFLAFLVLFAAGSGPGITVVYVSTFILNVLTVFYDIGIEAGIPDIVSPERLIGVNSASKVIEAAATIAGPVLGGLVYLIADIKLFMLMNAVSFLFSAASVLMLDFRVNTHAVSDVPDKPGINFFKDIRDAVMYIKDRQSIIKVFVFLVFLNLFTGFSLLVPLPFVLNNVLGLDPGMLGVIQGFIPVGAVAGAILVGKYRQSTQKLTHLPLVSRILAVCIILSGIPALFGGFFHCNVLLLLFYGPVMVLLGICISFIDIPLLSMLQLELPEDCRGRVLSLGMSLVKVASPLAFLAAGCFLKLLPSYVVVFSGGIGLLFLSGSNK